jgi:hypothetical protein
VNNWFGMWEPIRLVLLLFCLSRLFRGGWQKIPVSAYQYNFVAAAWGGTASEGVIVGTRDDSGVILYTADAGSTWTTVTSPSFPPMTSVICCLGVVAVMLGLLGVAFVPGVSITKPVRSAANPMKYFESFSYVAVSKCTLVSPLAGFLISYLII